MRPLYITAISYRWVEGYAPHIDTAAPRIMISQSRLKTSWLSIQRCLFWNFRCRVGSFASPSIPARWEVAQESRFRFGITFSNYRVQILQVFFLSVLGPFFWLKKLCLPQKMHNVMIGVIDDGVIELAFRTGEGYAPIEKSSQNRDYKVMTGLPHWR